MDDEMGMVERLRQLTPEHLRDAALYLSAGATSAHIPVVCNPRCTAVLGSLTTSPPSHEGYTARIVPIDRPYEP